MNDLLLYWSKIYKIALIIIMIIIINNYADIIGNVPSNEIFYTIIFWYTLHNKKGHWATPLPLQVKKDGWLWGSWVLSVCRLCSLVRSLRESMETSLKGTAYTVTLQTFRKPL